MRARAGAARQGRAARRRGEALPARVLRRPAPAHRHRARARGRAAASSCATSRSARSTSRSRRRSSTCSQDLQDAEQPDLPVHLARPQDRAAHLRPRRRDVPRPDRRARGRRRRSTATPKHPYTQALLSAVPRIDPRARRGSASSSRATCRARSSPPRGLPVPPALPGQGQAGGVLHRAAEAARAVERHARPPVTSPSEAG